MKRLITLIALSAICTAHAEPSTKQQLSPDPIKPDVPTKLKSRTEQIDAEILKVYSVTEGEITYRAYVIEWHDAEVVVQDFPGNSPRKVGDIIQVMVNTHIDPLRGGQIIFTYIEQKPERQKIFQEAMKKAGEEAAKKSKSSPGSAQ